MPEKRQPSQVKFFLNWAVLLGLTWASPNQAAASVQVEYKTSRMQGLVEFALALADPQRHAPALSEIFNRSEEKNPEVLKAVQTVQSVVNRLPRGIDFPSSVSNRQLGYSVLDLILAQSVYAKDLVDLSQRILGLMPLSDHRQLVTALARLESVYSRLIWEPNKQALLEHQKKLEVMAQAVNLNDMFQKAMTFYGGNWPPDVPFVIALFPVPALSRFQNSTTSHSIGSVEIHGVQTGGNEDDLQGSFGVIFHELCHSLYGSQSGEVMKQFDSYFRKNKSPFRRPALAWADEAIATALGNGWAYAKVNQQNLDSNDWYNNKIIAGYAKAIYPVVKSYIETGKSMDADFVNQMIDQFTRHFPNSLYNFENVLSHTTVLHQSSLFESSQLKSILRKRFPILQYNSSSPLVDPESIASARDENSLLFVVIKPTEIDSLARLAEEIPFLKEKLPALRHMPSRSYFAALDATARPYIIAKISSKEDLVLALDAMKSAQVIDPKTAVRSF